MDNIRELREELAAQGHCYQTDTDAVVSLVSDEIETGKSRVEAAAALSRMRGADALSPLFPRRR